MILSALDAFWLPIMIWLLFILTSGSGCILGSVSTRYGKNFLIIIIKMHSLMNAPTYCGHEYKESMLELGPNPHIWLN